MHTDDAEYAVTRMPEGVFSQVADVFLPLRRCKPSPSKSFRQSVTRASI